MDQTAIDQLKQQVQQQNAQLAPIQNNAMKRKSITQLIPLRYILWGVAPMLLLLFAGIIFLVLAQRDLSNRSEPDNFIGEQISLPPAREGTVSGSLVINLLTQYQNGIQVAGTATFDAITANQISTDQITANNILYDLTVGAGLASTGGQEPVLTNTGVLSFAGQTGAVNLVAGSGISIDGLTISSTVSADSDQNLFSTIALGSSSFSASSTTDTLTFASGDGITVSMDETAKKITISNSSSTEPLASADGTGNTSSFSGMELAGAGSDELALLQGCDDGDILKWNDSTNLWECGADVGGMSSAVVNIKEGGTLVTATADTLDFSAADFTLSESPSGEVNIVVDYASSLITRSDQDEVITGSWEFGAVDVTNGLTVSSGNLNLATGNTYQINGTTVLNANTLGSDITTSSLTTVGALSSGSIASGFGTIATANTITGTTLNGTTGINTGAGAGTIRINSSGNLVNIGSTQINGVTYTWPGADATSSGYVLTSNAGGTLSWQEVSGIGGVGDISAVGNVSTGAAFTTGGSGSSLYFHDSTFEGELTVATLTGDQSYTLPDISGTFCLSSGNCAGTGAGVGGSGTTNFVPKFSATYALTNSSIFDDGNVGIGTTDPTQKLHVNGRIQTDGGMLFNEGSASTDNLVYVGSVASGAVDASFGFFTAGVGSGSSAFGPYFLSRGNLFSAIANQRGNMYFNAGSPVTPGASEGRLVFTTDNDTPRMVIDRTGNIGIGITNPAHLLSVSGTTNITGLATFGAGVNVGGETITDFTGTGLSLNGTSLETTLGTDVALSTETTGDYVATITGSGTITSSGATTGEGIAHTLSVTADSIGDSQLAFNTGQDLTTTSDPTFDALSLTSLTVSGDTINDFVGTGLTMSGNILTTTLGTSVDLASAEVTGVLALANGGTNKNLTAVNGGIVWSDADSFEVLAAGISGQILTSGGAGTPTWTDAASLNFWQRNAGALAPDQITNDLLVGSNATASALIKLGGTTNADSFFNTGGNVGIGTNLPLARLDVSGNASLSGNLTFSGARTIAGSSMSTLTIGDASTGNIIFNPGGNIGIGTTTPRSKLTLNNITDTSGNFNALYSTISNHPLTFQSTYGAGGGALGGIAWGTSDNNPTVPKVAIWANADGSGSDLHFGTSNAYASGITTVGLTIDQSGNVGIGDMTPSYNLDVTGTMRITGAATFGSTVSLGGQTYTWPGSVSNGYILQTNGSGALSWIDPGSLPSSNYWRISDGTISPYNDTLDVLFGASASSSAKFAFLNMNGGSPTASISGNLSLVTPTGNNPSASFNLLNGGSLNFQSSAGGDAGLTSRLFVDNAGSIGIGNTTPNITNGLSVAGTLLNVKTAGISRIAIEGTQSDIFLTDSGASADQKMLMIRNDGGFTGFVPMTDAGGGVIGSSINIQHSNGNVGIGQSTAQEAVNAILEVGSYGAPSVLTSPAALFASNTNNVSGIELKNLSTGSSADFRFAIFDTAGDYVGLSQGGVNRSGNMLSNARNVTSYLISNGRPLAIGTIANDALIFGTNDTERMRIQGGNVGIGITNPAGKLVVAGTSNTEQLIIRANGTQTNVNPLVQLQDSSGNELLSLHSDTTSNVFLGYLTGINNNVAGNGNWNTFIGSLAGTTNATGSANTAIGYGSLDANTIGIHNTAVGYASLGSNTIGNANSALGLFSLASNTTGQYNVGVGRSAISSNTTGNYNVGLGSIAGWSNSTGSNNVSVGYAAGYSNVSGFNNTIIGHEAGLGVSTNSYGNNTLLGYRSGYGLTTGSNNLMLGYQAGDNITSGANNVIIGYDIDAVSATGSNQLNIGNTIYGDTSTGNVGIGTTSVGSYKLNVNGNSSFTGNLIPSTDDTYDLGSDTNRWRDLYLGPATVHVGTSTSDEYTISFDTTNNYLGFNVNGSGNSEIVFDANGNVGIGVTNPSSALEVAGDINLTGTIVSDTGLTTFGSQAYDWSGATIDDGFILTTDASGALSWIDPGTLPSSNYFQIANGAIAPLNITNDLLLGGNATASATVRLPGLTNQDAWFNLGTGNLGIGTTSPGAKLSFAADTTAAGGIDFGGDFGLYRSASGILTTTGALRFSGITNDITTGSNEDLTIIPNGNGDTVFYTGDSDTHVYFDTSKTTDLYSPSSGVLRTGSSSFVFDGNVGIGTTAPITKLQLNGATTGKALMILNETGDQNIFAASSSGTTRFVINNSGNVGIGTTSFLSTYALNASGRINATALNIGTSEVIGTDGRIHAPSTGSAAAPNYALNAFETGMYSTDGFDLGLTANGTSVAHFSAVTGNLGIGTTSPIGKMLVEGSPVGKALFNLNYTGTDQNIFTASSSGTTRFVINNSGNVGIGTSSPSQKLDVAGDMRVEGGATPVTEGNWDANDANVMDGATSVYVLGKYAYVTGGTSDNMAIVDISNPASPTTVGNWDPADANITDGTQHVYVSGKYAYVTGSTSDNMAIVDISNPASPTTVGNWDPNNTNVMNSAAYVYVSGKYAYVAGNVSDSLAIVDISNPAAPTTAGSWDPNDANIMDGAISVYVSGKYAYITGYTSDNLAVVDISNPASPTTVGNWDPNDANIMDVGYSVYISGKYAYVAGNASDNLAIVDISNPASPTTVGNWDPNDANIMDSAFSVYVSGKYAYVVGNTSDNLAIVDISDPASPTTVGNWDPNNVNVLDNASSVKISGKYAYITGSSSDNMAIVDLGGIETPNLFAGSIAGDTLQIENNAIISNNLYTGGLNVGTAGIMTDGLLSINGTGNNYISGNLGIGITSPSQSLDISGKMAVNGTQVLYLADQTNFTGTLIIGDGGGSLSHSSGVQGWLNTYIGIGAGLANTTGFSNTSLGYNSLTVNTTGAYNVSLGSSSLALNEDGAYNVAVGSSALGSNVSGDANVAIGDYALFDNTGDNNSALGHFTLSNNSTGQYNSAFGYSAGFQTQTGSNNALFGYRAGYGVSTNSYSNNSIFGYQAGHVLTTGSNNILLGYQAGDNITSGANNIILGYDVDAPSATGSNQLNIGNTIYGDLSTGNIGIGTTAPTGKLHIDGAATGKALAMFNQTGDQDIITASSSGTTLFVLQNDGDLGLGTNAPVLDLHIATNNTPAIRLEQDNTLYAAQIWDILGSEANFAIRDGTNGNLLPFRIEPGAATSSLYIDSTGFVGLGKATPLATLDVNGSASVSGNLSFSGARTIAATSMNNLTFGDSNTANIILGQSGNIGIGTTTPTNAKLEISNTTQDQIALYANGGVRGGAVTTTTSNSAVTSTITTPALVYYVQSSDTTGNCTEASKTFNITGLPAAEGAVAMIVSKASDAGCGTSGTITVTVQIDNSTIGTVAQAFNAGSVTTTESYVVSYINSAWRVIAVNSATAGGSDTFDLAEWMPYSGDEPLPGEVVSISTDGSVSVIKSNSEYDSRAIGIVSTNPHTTLGGTDGKSVRLALAGRVPVKVSTENGPVLAGDFLTTSSIPGVAMKATKSGATIGKAMESYSDSSQIGTVMTFVNVSWQNPSIQIASDGTVQLAQEGENWIALNDIGNIIDNTGAFSNATIAELKAGKINSEDIFTTNLVATSGMFDSMNAAFLASDNISINNTLSAGKITTDEIEMSDFKLSSTDSKLSIMDTASESTLFTVDLQGNAEFKGSVTTPEITAETGNIESLTVKNLIVENISGLTASSSAFFNLGAGLEADFGEFDFAKIDSDLTVLGSTTLREATVQDTLAIGAGELMINSNSINTLSDTFEIQSLAQAPVSIMADAIRIETDGTVHFAENVAFAKDVDVKGELTAQVISVPKSDISIQSDTISYASTSAGTTFIKAGQTIRTVIVPQLKTDSLVYITPLSDTQGLTPYVTEQKEATGTESASFTVKLPSTISHDLPFNFFIINQKEQITSLDL